MTKQDQRAERHIPVLLQPVLAGLMPLVGAKVIDGTFGAGGYTRALLKAGAQVIALDRDPHAIDAGKSLVDEFFPRLRLVHMEFSQLDRVVEEKVDAVILDIGVSSMQLDEAERGFSFQKDGPLDMRMAQRGFTASDVVNHLKARDLARIFKILGEERYAGRIARMIEKRRVVQPFLRTGDLAHAIEMLIGRKPGDRIHPATRVFQALRIYVNDEIGELARGLFAAERILKAGGRLGVVSFHSLEDRMVKRFFVARSGEGMRSRYLPEIKHSPATFFPLFKGGITANKEELQQNPRSRSARLRMGVRTDAEALGEDMKLFGLAEIAGFEGGKK
ncbi:16S rRNA (cytosine(1402)-N(4))-methyltransferase RsmH [Bartonella krasnovii]|uniref:Ribosomal RNA small subunit methyltransferase H n=1 Tax=Bartonella krasnovii TaxID=2267275 RepID=A0A5B9D2G8_9HYPH|nr:16S rRNA (cytosine(1402)-N(4))-methyltransferase RsmH [Bartonella krasnovii]QEE12479.1 16S rRNA (cytosine(1402)-N(4))-methyltransferase RsmH [Bartonella krasnovii]UNF28573.1 16S rRNA (cytosine(1402)-N(4))-methyltransferase RsmH [Bartonella krasnovii]UNF34951.1 16S rRNA (cytosine(1402)-N(4))-methyltransferase RsmH [Bartonella krasnovii]UNF36588.1 16S rRNA (cytosine(1402)-N(4))-methyltransferase RsmH [Bartonella krasnovii]UNF41664.1 16S rRNA (cytosine(1402)-N(4))-methyltransferase RsmH [Barto